jgi:hypothetical protein
MSTGEIVRKSGFFWIENHVGTSDRTVVGGQVHRRSSVALHVHPPLPYHSLPA